MSTEPPGVGGTSDPWLLPEADAFRHEVQDFASRIATYMGTADPAFEGLHGVVAEAVRLLFEDAFFETYPLVKRRMEMFGRD